MTVNGEKLTIYRTWDMAWHWHMAIKIITIVLGNVCEC